MNSQTTSPDSDTPGSDIIVRVAVGSSNPCKVESVRRAFDEVFSTAARSTTTTTREVQIVISTYNVSSGKMGGGVYIITNQCMLSCFFACHCKYRCVQSTDGR